MSLVRTAFHFTCILLFVLSLTSILWTHRSYSKETEPAAVATESPSADVSAKASEQAQRAEGLVRAEKLSADLERKRTDLENRERALVDLEKNIKDREDDLDKKMKELKAVREGLEASFEAQKKNGEEKVAKMVTVFETMQPKAASQVFETLDDWLAVEVIKRMDTKKVAKLMNLMEKNRSAKLSELLTGYFHPKISQQTDSKVGRSTASTEAAKPAAVESADGGAATKPVPSKGNSPKKEETPSSAAKKGA